jgi:CrcB protein
MCGTRSSALVQIQMKHNRELLYILVHLSTWAQIGVLIRTYLQKFFVLGCDGSSWGPCLSGGVYFEVLPPNMLGSFIMGLVGTSAMAKLDESKAITILGPEHPWQKNGPLQAGIRTGLCGSITTFSSWMLEAMQTCFQGNQWLTGIGQLVVGFSCAVFSFSLGTQCALLVHHAYWKDVPLEDEMLSFERKSAEYVFGRRTERVGRLSEGLEIAQPQLPRQMPLSGGEVREGDFVDEEGHKESGNGADRAGATEDEQEIDPVDKDKEFDFRPRPVDYVVGALLVPLTVGSCLGVAFETEHTWIRGIWLSTLFAPFGCIGRWTLGKLNYSLPGNRWDWLPLGTLVANWSGAIIDFVLMSIQIRVNPSYWGSLVLQSVETGFCGCLTTVSTLAAETMNLADLIPFSKRVYAYVGATFIGAFIWGLCFLGWAYWT